MITIKAEDNIINESFLHENGNISAKVCYPSFECENENLKKRLDDFYKSAADEFVGFCKKLSHSKNAPSNGNVSLDWYVPFCDRNILSVLLDAVIFDGKKRHAARISHNWDLEKTIPLRSKNAFLTNKKTKALYLDEICSKIHTRDGGFTYKKDAENLARKHFDFEKFYFVPKGLAFYYDSGLLCGGRTFPSFVIPFSEIEGFAFK